MTRCCGASARTAEALEAGDNLARGLVALRRGGVGQFHLVERRQCVFVAGRVHVQRADVYPKVSEHIADILNIRFTLQK